MNMPLLKVKKFDSYEQLEKIEEEFREFSRAEVNQTFLRKHMRR